MDKLLSEYFELEKDVNSYARRLNSRHGFNIQQWELRWFYLAQDRLAFLRERLLADCGVDVSEFELQF